MSSSQSSEKAKAFNELETAFIKSVFQRSTCKISADWAKVAEDMGLANSKSAKERYRQISQKHGFGSASSNGGPGQDSPSVQGTPRKARSTPDKRTPGSASKVVKRVKANQSPLKNVSVIVLDDEEEDDDEDEQEKDKGNGNDNDNGNSEEMEGVKAEATGSLDFGETQRRLFTEPRRTAVEEYMDEDHEDGAI